MNLRLAQQPPEERCKSLEDFQEIEYQNISQENIDFAIDQLKNELAMDLFEKNPAIRLFGHPKTLLYKKINTNLYWLENIYLFNILRKNIDLYTLQKKELVHINFRLGFGIFASIFKNEHPQSTQVLIHSEKELIFIKSLIQKRFPDAKVATSQNFKNQNKITRKNLAHYDFVLLNLCDFKYLEAGCADILSSFFQKDLHHFMEGKLFNSIPHLFCCNTYDTLPDKEFARVHISLNHLHSDYSPYYNFIARKKPCENLSSL